MRPFEERLEQELVAAARRRGADGGRPVRRRSRDALAGIAIALVLAALAVATGRRPFRR